MFIDINNADNFYINGNQGEKVYFQGRQIYPRNYYNEYFTIEPLSSGYLSSEQDLYYTTDDITWNFLSSNTPVYINDNKKYKIKGSGCRKIYYTGNYNIYGNILSLFYGDDFLTVRGVRLDGLFKNQTGLINAGNLILPNIFSQTGDGYNEMFEGCTSLVSAPALPATTLIGMCYYRMFRNCTSLASAPALPATTLSSGGGEYWEMFDGCTLLVNVPATLPATTVYGYSYCGMFRGCTSLVSAPALPATTLSYDCYKQMFQGCTSLVNAPALPAEEISQDCYVQMFQGCTSLVNAPTILPAATLYSGCYQYMFAGCTSLVNAPDLPATTLKDSSYYGMFYGCTSLNHVKCLAQFFQNNSTNDWLANVSTTGTFIKDDNTTWPTGASGIPTGWIIHNEHDHDYSRDYFTIESLENNNEISFILSSSSGTSLDINVSVDNGTTWTTKSSSTSGTLLATLNTGDKLLVKGSNTSYSASSYVNNFTSTKNINVSGNIISLVYGDNFIGQTSLVDAYAFTRFFYGNDKLVNAENLILSATTLTNYCYYYMFRDCTSLTAAPELPATTLARSCYFYMFYGCTSLTAAPALPATTLTDYCYSNMFSGCTSLTTAPALPATILSNGCYSNMFYGCTSLATAPDLPATILSNGCYRSMFRGCTSLNYIKCLATDISATNCLTSWLDNVAATGNFYKDTNTTYPAGSDGIPSGWTVINA